MKTWSRGFGYFSALAITTSGFMLGSTMLFAVILWTVAWVPALLWLLSPFLVFMIILEFAIFTMTMNAIRDGNLTAPVGIVSACHLFLGSLKMSAYIWHLAGFLLSKTLASTAKSRRRFVRTGAAVGYRFSMKPIQEQINQQFMGMCH